MLRINPAALSSSIEKFASETPAQRLQHREIAWRDRQRKRHSPKFINLRKKELELIFAKQYRGWQLPDDDAGRADLRIMMDHLAQLGEDHMRRWVSVRAPWLTDDKLDDLIDDVGPGRHWTAAALGKALNLDNATRMRLNIRTIRPVDRTKAQLDQDTKKRHAAAEADRRLKAGAKPRATAAERTKPWLALGISRRTYYRKLANDTLALIQAPYS
jgi:hypothetical protein